MIKNLRRIFEKYNIFFLLIIVLTIISVSLLLQGPKLLGQATDLLAKRDVYIINILVKMLLIFSIVFLLNISRNIMLSLIGMKISFDLREKISMKINRLSIAKLDSKLDGDTISLITNDVDTIYFNMLDLLMGILPCIIYILTAIVIMASISLKLFLIVAIYLPISLLFMMLIGRISKKYYKQQQEKIASLNAYIEEIYSNHDVILAFNGQQKALDKFDEINNDLFTSAFFSQFLSGITYPMLGIINNLNYIAIFLYGSLLLLKSAFSFGSFQAFIQYINNLNPNIMNLANSVNILQQTKAASDRIYNFLDEEEMENEQNLDKIDIENIKGNIIFKNLNFSYNDDKKVLNNINFEVKAGEKVAIVGHTGSGKTTIINLLMKFYNTKKDSIYIDGIDICDIKREDIANIFTMVLQDTWLFEGSIKDNITFSVNYKVDMDKIIEAAKKSNIHHFIKTLKNGYDTKLNEESSNISIGQKQQLTIARAFLKESKILILDEATSSIDSRTEKLIQMAMTNLMADKTCFIIAHRLSTIKNCDKIIMLENGNIVEMGTHEELMQNKAMYYNLYSA